MDKKLAQLIDESIKLELNISKIYMFFCNTFSEDSEFWRKLALEEKNHADIIKNGKGRFLLPGQFPSELLVSSVQTLCKTKNIFN
jgi:hypothetical protein